MKKILATALLLLFLPGLISAQIVMTLDDCVLHALDKNPDLNRTVAQLGMAKANRLQAWSNILPNISFSAGPTQNFRASSRYEDFVPTGQVDNEGNIIYEKRISVNPGIKWNSYYAQFSVDQNIWDTGRWWNQIRQGNAEVRANEYALQNNAITIVLLVKERFYNLVKVLEQQKVLQEAVQVAEEQLKNSQSMFEIGTVAQVDIFRSRVNLGNNQIALLNHELLIEDAKNQLNIAMGRNIGEPIDIESNIPVDIDYNLNLDDLMHRGVSRHPQLLQLENSIENAGMGVKIAESGRYPTLAYWGNYSRSNSELDRIYNDFNQNYQMSMGLRLRFNLFDGFQTKSNIQLAENQTRMYEEDYLNAKLQIQSNIRNYYFQLHQFNDKIAISREMVEAANEELRLENERYRVGTGTLIETIQAQSSYTSSRFGLVEMQFDAKIAEARLNAAVGNLDDRYRTAYNK